jgi:D-aminopeptidase
MEQLIPGIVTVPVKVGTGLTGAVTLPPQEAREKIRAGAAQALKLVDQIEPFRVQYPLIFREELKEPGFDEWNPPAHSRVIDSRTREIEALDIIDLSNKLYGYDPQFRPLPYDSLIQK